MLIGSRDVRDHQNGEFCQRYCLFLFVGRDMASLVFIITFLLMAPQLKSIPAENITEDDGMIMDDLMKTEMCPDTIKVRWDELLAREPHVIKQVSGNETSYDGLFPCE